MRPEPTLRQAVSRKFSWQRGDDWLGDGWASTKGRKLGFRPGLHYYRGVAGRVGGRKTDAMDL